jgi:hypothetical protein
MLLLARRSFSTIDPNAPLKQTVEKERGENMNSEHANCRKVLASFLEEIPKTKGWWHRLPLAPMSSKHGKPIATDAILPHLGSVFGLSEQAMMLLFLVEMGCYQAKGERCPGSRMAAKIKFGVVDEQHHLLCISPAEVSATMRRGSMSPCLWSWWFRGFQKGLTDSSNQQST